MLLSSQINVAETGKWWGYEWMFYELYKKKYPDWIIWCSLVVSSDEEIPHWTLNHHYCCWCCIWFLAPLLPLHASWRTWLRTSRSLRSVETLILILCLLLTRLQDLESKKNTKVYKEYNATWISPGMSTWESHPLTSSPRHCRTLRSSWERRREWPAGAWRRIRIHPPQPAITCVVSVEDN